MKFNIQRLYEAHVRILKVEQNVGCQKTNTSYGGRNSTCIPLGL